MCDAEQLSKWSINLTCSWFFGTLIVPCLIFFLEICLCFLILFEILNFYLDFVVIQTQDDTHKIVFYFCFKFFN